MAPQPISPASPFLTSELDGGEWPASRSDRITPGRIAPGTTRLGGWVGLSVSLDAVDKRKSCHVGNLTWAFQPAARRYTDGAIPTPHLNGVLPNSKAQVCVSVCVSTSGCHATAR
jgi:hypothetical protein